MPSPTYVDPYKGLPTQRLRAQGQTQQYSNPLPPLASTSPVLRGVVPRQSSTSFDSQVNGGGWGMGGVNQGRIESLPPDARFPNAGWGTSYSRGDILAGRNRDLTGMTNIENQIYGGAIIGGVGGGRAGGGATSGGMAGMAGTLGGVAAPPRPPMSADQFNSLSAAQSRPGQVVPSQISPEAMAMLTPETALALQAQSELEAQRLNEGYAQQSAAMLGAQQGTDEGTGFSSQYWASMKRAQEGDIRARFAMQDDQIREEGRNRNPMWTARMLKESQDRATGDILRAQASIDRDRTTQAEEARLNRAKGYLALNQAQPYQGTSWTTGEDYIRGAGYSDQLMAQSNALFNERGMNAGGGVPSVTSLGGGLPAIRAGGVRGLRNSVPADQTWGEGPGGVSQPGQGNYFGRAGGSGGGGGAVTANPYAAEQIEGNDAWTRLANEIAMRDAASGDTGYDY